MNARASSGRGAAKRLTRTVAARMPRAQGTPRIRPRAGALEIVPVTAALWPQLAKLFGPRGACAGCWCMWPRLPAAEYRAQRPKNRQALQRLVKAGDPPGVLAFEDGRPVGWAAVAPRAAYRRFESSHVMAPVDDQPVWSVPCFFIARTHRRRGVTVQLLRAACTYAAERGARIVEGYPIDPPSGPVAPTFAWHGLAGTFRAVGFREVARRSPTRPVMRKAVRPARSRAARG